MPFCKFFNIVFLPFFHINSQHIICLSTVLCISLLLAFISMFLSTILTDYLTSASHNIRLTTLRANISSSNGSCFNIILFLFNICPCSCLLAFNSTFGAVCCTIGFWFKCFSARLTNKSFDINPLFSLCKTIIDCLAYDYILLIRGSQ